LTYGRQSGQSVAVRKPSIQDDEGIVELSDRLDSVVKRTRDVGCVTRRCEPIRQLRRDLSLVFDDQYPQRELFRFAFDLDGRTRPAIGERHTSFGVVVLQQ
jgi:hypothetical protein